MEKVVLRVPTMWADHHILAVREALGQTAGVTEVVASAMYKDVVIQYDPAASRAQMHWHRRSIKAGYRDREGTGPSDTSQPHR